MTSVGARSGARLVLVVTITSCGVASSGSTGASWHDAVGRAPSSGASSMRVIRDRDIVLSGSGNIEDVVRRYRPQFLMPRVSGSHGGVREHTPLVYVNGVRAGGLEVLRMVPTSSVLEVRFVPEMDANVEFTGDHPGGVIALRTRAPAHQRSAGLRFVKSG